ncbi:MAG: c-type cytochrome biogenesis protein CcsB [Actinobacteria bacterium]|nr:c-type cytochrome biogenesis protein CcsB [Actinomycetota bacterium]
MAIYTFAFLADALNLASRASQNKDARARATVTEKAGLFFLIFATVLLAIGVVLRAISVARVPWGNMYEYAITGTLTIAVIFLIARIFVKEIQFVSLLISGFALLTLGAATTLFYVEVASLMPALQNYWLIIHVSVAVLATAFFNIAAALSVAYLLKTAGWVQKSKLAFVKGMNRLFGSFPADNKLERLSYRFNIIGFILWTFTLIAGAIWAERAWHRYWGWDTKEVWTFIIWTLYAGYLHANATRGWSGKRSAWLSLVGFAAVIFNFVVVNLYFKGLHVYSGL